MEVFKVVLDDIELSAAEQKRLSSAMEKATLDLLAKRRKPVPVDSVDPKDFLRELGPRTRGRLIIPEGLPKKEIATVVKRQFGS